MSEATRHTFSSPRCKCFIELDGKQWAEFQSALAAVELAWKEGQPWLGALWFVWADKGPTGKETSDTSILHNEHCVTHWSPNVD